MRFALILYALMSLGLLSPSAPAATSMEWSAENVRPAFPSSQAHQRYLPASRDFHEGLTLVASNGDHNRDPTMVRDAQRMLNELGFSVGAVDGVYGRKTYHAIVDFEKSQKMPLTGNVTVPLLLILTEKLSSAKANAPIPSSGVPGKPAGLGVIPATPKPDGFWSLGHKTAAFQVLESVESRSKGLRFGLLTHRHPFRAGPGECTYKEVDIWVSGSAQSLSPKDANLAASLTDAARALSSVCPDLSVVWVAVRTGGTADGPELGGGKGGLYVGRLHKDKHWVEDVLVHRAISIPSDWDVGPQLTAACYRNIRGHDVSEFELAVEQCEIALRHDPGNTDLLYQLGRLENLRRRYGPAIEWFVLAATGNNSNAYSMLGHFHEMGKGVARNPAQAAVWYAKASEKSVPWAARNLGQMYVQGRGVPTDLLQAKSWFERAKANGDPQAVRDLTTLTHIIEGSSANGRTFWQCDCLDVERCGVSPFSLVVESQSDLPLHYGACRPWP